MIDIRKGSKGSNTTGSVVREGVLWVKSLKKIYSTSRVANIWICTDLHGVEDSMGRSWNFHSIEMRLRIGDFCAHVMIFRSCTVTKRKILYLFCHTIRWHPEKWTNIVKGTIYTNLQSLTVEAPFSAGPFSNTFFRMLKLKVKSFGYSIVRGTI